MIVAVSIILAILFIVFFSAWSNRRSAGIIARLTATPPHQHGVEQARYYAAQYHYAYAERQWKVSLAPNTGFRGRCAARETDVHKRVPDAYCQPNTEGGQEREAAAKHETCALERLGVSELSKIVKQALKDKVRGLGKEKIQIVAKAMDLLLEASNGDARTVLNALEIASKAARKDKQGIKHISLVDVEDALQHKALQYDKKGEEHYNVISAFIKSMRGSNPDGALYWLNRMVEAGEDPEFIARRMVIFASEDVGMADPGALRIALDVFNAVRVIGYPECQINLAHGVVYLANAPKDNSAYKGLLEAKKDVQDSMNEPVPLHLRNAVTDLMKDLKYGEGYKYSHDFTPEEGEQDYLPEKLRGKKYYKPRK